MKRFEKIILKKAYADTMNPFEYWYAEDAEIRTFFDSYFTENKSYLAKLEEKDRIEMEEMFEQSNVIDKMLVLTAIAGVKKIYA